MVVSILSRIYIVCDCVLVDPNWGVLGTRATVQFFQFHAVFGGGMVKIIDLRPPLDLTPLSRKSWIHH